MMVGYARVSTRRQNLDLQIDALQKAGCNLIIVEKISGRARYKHGLAAAIASCSAGDTLVAWKIDRLGRDFLELVEIARLLKSRDVGLKILSGRASLVDIATVEGRAIYGIFAAVADIEHAFGSDRTKAGVGAARMRRAKAQTLPARKLQPARSKAVGRFKRLRCAFNHSRE